MSSEQLIVLKITKPDGGEYNYRFRGKPLGHGGGAYSADDGASIFIYNDRDESLESMVIARVKEEEAEFDLFQLLVDALGQDEAILVMNEIGFTPVIDHGDTE